MRKRKKVRNGVRKGELSFKKEGGISFTLRDSCVPSRLEVGWVLSLLRQRIRIQKRHWRTAAAKSGGIWSVLRTEVFVNALTAGCFLSGSVHFSFRIAVADSGLPRCRKSRAKNWKCLIRSRLVFIENKVCSEHHGRQNCGKAKCPHKSTGIGCSGGCRIRHLFCDLPNDSFAEKCCKSLLFRRKNRYRVAFGFRGLWACLTCRQVGAQHEKTALNYNFRV